MVSVIHSSQCSMGDSFWALKNNDVKYPALYYTITQALGENVGIHGPAVTEPQPPFSYRKHHTSNRPQPKHSGAPIPAGVDRNENAPSHTLCGSKSRARRHNVKIPTPLVQLAIQLPSLELDDIDDSMGRPVEKV
ncbi:hypothetical protein CFO_g1371 [Ceratocystis platani]|uniref:Uncharacterized protein n=1 Tax=Ceratocystis fimbriata f. sp. platani TaxID=88771 RepID=A0A0F8D0F4_CERFI|nr:hypothetical protein CFO_g1371 [Ceratocystis platani]